MLASYMLCEFLPWMPVVILLILTLSFNTKNRFYLLIHAQNGIKIGFGGFIKVGVVVTTGSIVFLVARGGLLAKLGERKIR